MLLWKRYLVILSVCLFVCLCAHAISHLKMGFTFSLCNDYHYTFYFYSSNFKQLRNGISVLKKNTRFEGAAPGLSRLDDGSALESWKGDDSALEFNQNYQYILSQTNGQTKQDEDKFNSLPSPQE